MSDVEVLERYQSPSWQGATPKISVVVSTYRRSSFLPELFESFEGQSLDPSRFEVVIVDNGSDDDTWSVLERSVGSTPLRVQAVRAGSNRGPAGGRNLGIRQTRAPVVAFTDDDCLPASGWLAALLAATANGYDVVQGTTEPRPGDRRTSAWDRTVEIAAPTRLFETCNIAYRRSVLDQLGGFDDTGTVVGHRAARPFGEDAELGWRSEAEGAVYRFEPEALVHHRWLPASYRDWLQERRQLGNFAALARRIAGFDEVFWQRWFLTKATAAFDLAVIAVLVSVSRRRPFLLVGIVPWIAVRWHDAGARPGRNRIVRLAQLAAGDLVGMASLLEGSVRHRRVVL